MTTRTRATARHLAAIGIVAAALLTACGSDSESSDSGVSSDSDGTIAMDDPETPTQDVDADTAAAQAALLTLTDFPTGWSEIPDDEANDDEELDSRVAACLGSAGTELFDTEAKADSGTFTDPADGSTVEETTGLAATVEEAAALLAGFGGGDVTTCLTEVYNDRFREIIEESVDLGGAELGEITVGALNITPVGDEYYAFQVEIPISLGALVVTPTADLVAVRVGRSVAGLTFFSEDGASPIERIDQYTALAAGRLPTS